jgi:hypothetical protein
MRIGSLLLVVMASAALVACSSTGKRGLFLFEKPFVSTQRCDTHDCPPVTVTVTEAGDTCSGSVDFYVIDFRQGPGPHRVTWTITGNYVFSSEPYKFGIFIKNDPRKQFKNALVQGNGKRLVIDFAHDYTGHAYYEYSLNFQRADGSFCDALDPWMED